MEHQNLIVNKSEQIAILYINRPKVLNALNRDTLLELDKAIDEIEQDQEVNVLIITGSGGKAFVAGADIAYMQNLSAIEGRAFGALGQKVFSKIESI